MRRAKEVLVIGVIAALVIDALYWVVHPLIPYLFGTLAVLFLFGAWYRRKRWW